MGICGSKLSSTSQHPAPSSSPLVEPSPGRVMNGDALDLTARIQNRSQTAKSGGFSNVYEAELGPDGTKVAVKCLRAVHIGNLAPNSSEAHDRLDKRLQREMRVWKRLEHPGIVPCLGYSTLEGMPCLVSPWYANGNAREYIAKNPGCDRKALIAQVAEALVYLHAQRPAIIHYDVKSLNVLIDDEGGARLTDFGISKMLDDSRTGFTTSGATPFTVRCSSPEALEGKDRSVKSDVYSFACFALEIMTSKTPFYDLSSSAAVIAAKQNGATPNPSQFPELAGSDPLWALLRSCWKTRIWRRPTMRQVLRKLNSLSYKAS